jgi:signal transduction histidine kinase
MGPNISKRTFPGSKAKRELVIIVLIALIVFIASSRLDVFERVVDFVHHHERYELDELVVLLSVLCIAVAVFAARRWADARREFAKRMEAERMKVLLEAVGTVSHELSQPLQVAMGASEMALLEAPQGSALQKHLSKIISSTERIAVLLNKLNGITVYRTKPYVGGVEILDLD